MTTEKEDLKSLLSSETFRRFVYGLLRKTGVESDDCGYNDDARREAFNLGARSVGLHLKNMIFEADLASYNTMKTEYKLRSKAAKENKETYDRNIEGRR